MSDNSAAGHDQLSGPSGGAELRTALGEGDLRRVQALELKEVCSRRLAEAGNGYRKLAMNALPDRWRFHP